MYTIGIVDDHQLFSNALQTLVNSTSRYSTSFIAASGEEFRNKLPSLDALPHIILMDVNLGDTSGVEETRWCNERYPDIRIVALSMDSSKKTVLQMIRAGACGYLLKDIVPDDFVLAMDYVIEKGFYHSELVTEALLHKIQEDKVVLKESEQTFLEYACSDLTYKEIAGEMFLSPKTIDKYREKLFKKFNVKSRVALALFAIKKGYVEV